MIRKEPVKGGQHLDPSTTLEVMFLRNLIEEFLEVVKFVNHFESQLQSLMFSTTTKSF